MQGHILEDRYLFDRQFNAKKAAKMIVKSRPLQGKSSHSETYFVSEDNQVLYISFHSGQSRVDIIRIQWSNQEKDLSYKDLIKKFAEKHKNDWKEYDYEEEYDLTKLEKEFEFMQIQEFARKYASTPYTLTLSNCNHGTNWLIKQINPDIKSKVNNYGNWCAIF